MFIVQSSTSSWLRFLAATAASLHGLNSVASTFNSIVFWLACLSQLSSNGYKCCTGRSTKLFPARNFNALTTPSFPWYSCSTIPRGHSPLFLSSDLIITTSPTDKLSGFPLSMMCRSRKPRSTRLSIVSKLHLCNALGIWLAF